MQKNLQDLTKELAAKLDGIDDKDVERVVNEFVELTKTAMTAGEVMIRGFGKFFTKKHGEKKARNPHTGESIMVPSRVVPRFKFSNAFSRDIRDGKIIYSPIDNVAVDFDNEWYVAIAGKPEGPFNKDQIAKMLKDKEISEQSLVYNPEVGGDWVELGKTELKPVPTVPPIPPVPTIPNIPSISATAATA